MTIEEALKAKLLSVTSLTALIGTQVFPDEVPQKTTGTALKYEHLDGPEDPYLSGEVNDLHRDTFRLGIVAAVRKNVAAVRDVILSEFGGTAARGLWQPGIFVSGCFPRTGSQLYPPIDGSERYDREATVDLVIIWGRR